MEHMVYFTEKDKSMPTEKSFSLNKTSLFWKNANLILLESRVNDYILEQDTS